MTKEQRSALDGKEVLVTRAPYKLRLTVSNNHWIAEGWSSDGTKLMANDDRLALAKFRDRARHDLRRAVSLVLEGVGQAPGEWSFSDTTMTFSRRLNESEKRSKAAG